MEAVDCNCSNGRKEEIKKANDSAEILEKFKWIHAAKGQC